MKKLTILFFIALFLGFLVFLLLSKYGKSFSASASECQQAQAECNINNSSKSCCGGLMCGDFNEHSGNGKCIPVITPTPTPGITGTPTPSIPSSCGEDVECITPTPIATPTATPTPTPNNGGTNVSDGNAPGVSTPSCGDTTPGNVPNFTVIVNSKGMELEWAIIPGASGVDVEYGLQNGVWIYGVLNIPNTGNYEVQGLTPNTAYWYRIAGVNGCAIGNFSNAIDPIYTGR